VVHRYIQAASKEVARSRVLEFTIRAMTIVAFVAVIFSPCVVVAQTRGSREIKVPYTLGGSTGYFWVAYRSGAFERRGLKIQPIYIRSGFAALQSLLAREVEIELQGGSAATTAWAKGAKDLVYVAACGNRLDYILIAHSSIHKAQDLKGKIIAISQIGASADFIARYALRQLGLNAEKDVTYIGLGGSAERWAALTGNRVAASVFQPPLALLARKAGYPVLLDISKQDFQYIIAGILTTRSFIRAEPDTIMNFLRALADGMEFYRDEKNKDAVTRFLGEFYRLSTPEELEETRKVYSQFTSGIPVVTAKAIENVISNDRALSTMNLRGADMLDLSFLQRLEEERRVKTR